MISMPFVFHLRCVMNVVLQLRNSGSETRLNGSRAARDGGGSDPTATLTHGASKGGVLPPHPNLAASFLASSSWVNSLAFYKFALPPR